MSLEAGQTLAQYRLVERIGEGGMGVVWKARDTNLERDVAIKMLPVDVAASPERLQRFESEARTTGVLNHPNIVAVFDFGRFEGAPYIVMELVEGESLREKAARAPLPPRKVSEYVIQVARGLAAAHDKGVVHRDLKPDNILITPGGQAKILDFGLAKLVEQGSGVENVTRTAAGGVTAPGAVMGTVGYMAPEQVRGREVDHRTDIFALGTILYELLSGRRAFQADSAVETLNAILTGEPPALSGEQTRISPILDRIVRRCMEKEPGERFQSADDLAFALQAIGDSSSSEMPRLDVGSGAAWRSRGPALAVAGALVLAVAAFLAGRALAPGAGTHDGPSSGAILSQLTFDAGVERQPSISPDGRSIVYVSDADGGDDIYLQRVGGETAINLTNSPDTSDVTPMFSPDGGQIAFRSSRDGGGVFVMGATGESVRRLTDFGYNPSWSPDGASVLVTTEHVGSPYGRGTRAGLWRIEVATGESTRLTREGDDAVQARYSPDGSRIAYWGLPIGTARRVLYTMPAGGGEGVPVAEHEAVDWSPVWSPDGRRLYFLSDRNGTMNVWRVRIDADDGRSVGDPEPVTVSAVPIDWLDVASTTGRVVFGTQHSLMTQQRVALDAAGRVAGDPETLVSTSMRLSYASASPDGSWLAFTGAVSQEDLYVLEIEPRRLRRLTTDPYNDRGPYWSPDSERLYFYSDRAGRYEIWSIRVDGSGLEQVTATSGGSTNTPRVSPDGTRALVLRETGDALIDLTGAMPVTSVEPLPRIDDELHMLRSRWSPDGRRLVGQGAGDGERGGRGIWLFDLETGEYRELLDAGDSYDWLDDGRIAVQLRDEGIVAIDLTSSARETLAPGVTSSWFLAPDRSFLYYESPRIEGDVWMLDSE